MGGLEYFATGKLNWARSMGFVMRNVLSENMAIQRHKTHRLYEKVLVLAWVWSCFVLVMSFSGNLTAMITRPKLDMKFMKPEHFLDQEEISLVIEEGVGAVYYMSASPINSTLRRLIDKTQRMEADDEWASNCFTRDAQNSRKHASICDNVSILTLLDKDFVETGKCNWYTLESGGFYQGFSHVGDGMAFQVCRQRGVLDSILLFTLIFIYCRKIAPIWRMPMSLFSLQERQD